MEYVTSPLLRYTTKLSQLPKIKYIKSRNITEYAKIFRHHSPNPSSKNSVTGPINGFLYTLVSNIYIIII